MHTFAHHRVIERRQRRQSGRFGRQIALGEQSGSVWVVRPDVLWCSTPFQVTVLARVSVQCMGAVFRVFTLHSALIFCAGHVLQVIFSYVNALHPLTARELACMCSFQVTTSVLRSIACVQQHCALVGLVLKQSDQAFFSAMSHSAVASTIQDH